jgi:hypothetical protein
MSSLSFAQKDEELVQQTIVRFFDGMRLSDTAMIRSTFASNAIMQTVNKNKVGEVMVLSEVVDSFLYFVTKPHSEIYDERIRFDIVKVDADLAMAWTPYKFYVGEKFSHCGVNSFQLIRLNGAWKIQYIIDTRRRQPCE